MRQIIPFIFWPWFATSCFILLRRRVTGGSWRAISEEPEHDTWASPGGEAGPAPEPAPVVTAPPPRARSLAEALEGIEMPCDLAPLIGNGEIDPRSVSFFTTDTDPATVGEALADELERLGYDIEPLDDRSIRANRGNEVVRAALVSVALAGEMVMADRHPSAPADALVVELTLV